MRVCLLLCLYGCFAMVLAQTTESQQQLLEKVKQNRQQEAQRNLAREQRFLAAKQQQAAILANAKADFERYQTQNNPLKQRTDANAKKIAQLQAAIEKRKSEIGDVDSILQQMTGDFASALNQSPVTMQRPERVAQLAALSSDTAITSVERMESLWLLVQEEMTLAGDIARFDAPVVMPNGVIETHPVRRVGTFSSYLDGAFLRFVPETRELLLNDKPSPQAVQNRQYFSGTVPITTLWLDPTGGSLLGFLAYTPTWQDRLDQGGIIGRIIVGIGILGLLIILWRSVSLGWHMLKLSRQLTRIEQPSNNNALGRVLLRVGHLSKDDLSNDASQMDIAQLKVDEAVLNEVNGLERGHNLLKLLAAVAPLLGLLGTVTGMIITFQSISLFGSGDPKLMAGGISQALITTVLGLVVAIPLLFGHSLVSAFADNIIRRLDEQSAGFLAQLVAEETPPNRTPS